jgi:CheY-like chemotaxis protein
MNEGRALLLVADDNPSDLMLVRAALGEAAFDADALTARDGQEALETLRSGLRPDLVLTDLQMPRLDGLHLVEAIRRDHPDLRRLMTASEAKRSRPSPWRGASYVLSGRSAGRRAPWRRCWRCHEPRGDELLPPDPAP